jgi:hypothetical protein
MIVCYLMSLLDDDYLDFENDHLLNYLDEKRSPFAKIFEKNLNFEV